MSLITNQAQTPDVERRIAPGKHKIPVLNISITDERMKT